MSKHYAKVLRWVFQFLKWHEKYYLLFFFFYSLFDVCYCSKKVECVKARDIAVYYIVTVRMKTPCHGISNFDRLDMTVVRNDLCLSYVKIHAEMKCYFSRVARD